MKKHRNESNRHFEAKLEYHYLIPDLEWSKFYEVKNADIVLYHQRTEFMPCIEFEQTVRNAVRNVKRNLKNGCHAVATVALDERFRNQIENKIRRHIKAKHHDRIKVFSNDDQGRADLLAWLTELATKHGSSTE